MQLEFARIAANAVFTIEHYLALLILAVLAFAIGLRLTRNRINFHNALEQVSFSVGIGLGAISFLVLLLGELHILYWHALTAALIAAVHLSHAAIFDWFQELRRPTLRDLVRRWKLIIAVGLIVGAAVPFLVRPLYPAKDWDATQYHLAAPKIYIKEHAVVFTPYLRYPVFPQTNQMLFTGALLLYDEQFAQQVQFLMLLTLVAAMIAFARRHLTSRAGWWGAALLLASPLIIHLGSIAYADVGLMFFCFLASYAFWNWLESRETGWMVLTGVASGLAFGAKYTGAFFPVIFFAVLIWKGWRKRDYAPPLILTAVTFLVAAPWLIRGIYFTGNPVFPFLEDFFTSIFGQRMIDPEWFRAQIGASMYIGLGRSLWALVTLPWNIAFRQAAFEAEAPLSVIAVLLVPLGAVFGIFNSRVRWILLLAIAYTLFWFFGYQYVRYLVPAFPLYCLATAASLDWLLSRQLMPRWLESGAVTTIVSLALIYPCWYWVAQHDKWEGYLPTTAAEREQYLIARIPQYPAYQFLNRQLGSNYRLYALDDVKMAYHADGEFLGDWYGEANYRRITSKMHSGEALYDELKALRVDHFLLNSAVEKTKLPRDDFFNRNFRLIFAGNDTQVFELSEQKVYQ